MVSVKNGKAFLLADQALESSDILSHCAGYGCSWIDMISMLDIETEDGDADYTLARFTKKTIEKYFPDSEDRVCWWRAQALMNNTEVEEVTGRKYNKAAPWWLWPETFDDDSIQYYVDENGQMREADYQYDLGIRPMICIG